MNVLQDNLAQIKRADFATNKPMVVKRTLLGNALMPPPSNAIKRHTTPSSNRSRPKDGCQSITSHTKSTPTVRRDSHVIVSICEGRGKATGNVGIATVDIRRPILILSQFSDTQTYTSTLTKLNILRPAEVLVPATFIEGAAQSRLVTVIMEQFPNLSVASVPRSEFNRLRGIQIIQSICAPVFNSVILQINHKFYASAASCALLRYIEQSRHVLYSPKTVKVEFQEPEHTTAIDIDTAGLLELVASTGKQNVSLFTVLDHCSTIPGRKLLRASILQPPCCKNDIETRLDCVQELIENPNLLTRLQETLKPLSDIDASLTFGTVVPATASSVSERQLNYTLRLKGLLNAVQPLSDELRATKHPVFKDIYNRIEGLDTRKKILGLISEVMNEDAHLSKGQAGELQRCFAIKSGINGFLDLSRRLYSEGVDCMRSYVDDLTASYNLPLRFQHTIKNGFHIILPLTKALSNMKRTDLPPVFIKVERFSTHFYLTTMDMINFDKRLKNNSAEIQNISNMIIYQVLVDIRPYIGDLYQLCDDVAQLDMFVSLARTSSSFNWVRPRLVDTHLNLEGARHPLLEHVADQEPVANSMYAYPRCNMHIITGPNMSGKTILLHSLCLIQVLCQLGCFVPCTKATMRVSDRVFVRVADDGTALSASSFALEMTKLAYLLNMLTDKSLVVLDELCKTTACDEGVSLAMAVCEKMMTRGCFVFVASHFISLTILADLYPCVANWHLETLEEHRDNNERISLKFTYRLLPGVTSVDSYGIKLSRIFNSSKSISNRADELYKYLLPMRKSLASESASNKPEYLKFKLQSELDLLKIRNQLLDEIQNDKITNFQIKTGLSFEPSPLTLAPASSNSISLQQTSSNEKKKDSSNSLSAEKKLSSESNNWAPTASNKSDETSNHEFSVPNSIKTSSNQNQGKSSNKHVFSIDFDDINQQNNLFAPDGNMTFFSATAKPTEWNSFHSQDYTFPERENDQLSSIHKNISSTQNSSLPTAWGPKKNFLFYNSLNKGTQSQDGNLMFPDSNEFSSMQRNLLEFDENNKKSKSSYSQETNWSSAENTFIDNNILKTANIIVNSTPSKSTNYSQNINNQFSTSVQIHDVPKNITMTSSKDNSVESQQNFSIQVPKTSSLSKNTTSNLEEHSEQSESQNNISVTNSSPAANSLIQLPKLNSLKESSVETRSEQNISPNNFSIISKSDTNSLAQVSKSPLLSKNSTLIFPKGNDIQSEKKENISQKTSLSDVSETNSSVFSKIPKTASIFENSSPIITRNYNTAQNIPSLISKQNQEIISSIPTQIRLVSNLYDTSSDSENTNENEESKSDDSITINKIVNEKIDEDLLEVSTLDELDFANYLNLRNGITSTPINKEELVDNQKDYCTVSSSESDKVVEINQSSEYFTANSKENTHIVSPSVQSPVMTKRKSPQIPEFNKLLAKKRRKHTPLLGGLFTNF